MAGSDSSTGPGAGKRNWPCALLRQWGFPVWLPVRSGSFPGGQRQRVSLARAMAQEPELLLLDEPTAALDWQAQRDILDTIAALKRDRKMTVIMVTHDLNAVFHLAEKVAMLRGGSLIWQGNAEDAVRADLLERLYGVPIAIAEHEGRKIALF